VRDYTEKKNFDEFIKKCKALGLKVTPQGWLFIKKF